jgi:hypothetical protein
MFGMCIVENIDALEFRWEGHDYHRHFIKTQEARKKWNDCTFGKLASQKGRASKYNPYLTPQEVESFERGCIENKIRETRKVNAHYYQKFNEKIGACRGEKTRYILVKCSIKDNTVYYHGFPATENDIRLKGLELD